MKLNIYHYMFSTDKRFYDANLTYHANFFFSSESYPDELCTASFQCLDVNSTCVNQYCVCDYGMYSNDTRCEMRKWINLVHSG